MKTIIRTTSHFRLLIPAILTAILVADSLLGYVAPAAPAGIEPATKTVHAAAEIPELETVEQAEKTIVQPQGTAGKLAAVKDPGNYKDGVYTGSARGFGGIITVKVTIKNGKIASIGIVSAAGETGSFLGRAKAVIGRILKGQSTNVDAVSGATYSSNGIIKAVRNALAKAASKKSGSKKKPSKETGNENSKPKPVKPAVTAGGNWKDGTYIGEGEGFSGKLHVEVTIKDGKIASVKLLDTEDDKSFMNKAKAGVLKAVVKKQSTDVDAVSGATYSSYGLIEAINDALKKASADAKPETGDDPADDPDPQEPDPQEETENITMTSWVYYDESEDFDDYQLTVTFSSVKGKVKEISDYSQTGPASNNRYIRNAVEGINSQLSAGTASADIDTVTGATCTSTTIIEMMSGITSGERDNEEDSDKAESDKDAEGNGDGNQGNQTSDPGNSTNNAGNSPDVSTETTDTNGTNEVNAGNEAAEDTSADVSPAENEAAESTPPEVTPEENKSGGSDPPDAEQAEKEPEKEAGAGSGKDADSAS